jgi:hypothetical protein
LSQIVSPVNSLIWPRSPHKAADFSDLIQRLCSRNNKSRTPLEEFPL